MTSFPASTTALRILDQVIHKKRAAVQSRLPTTRELAAAAGVSLVTMWRAVSKRIADGTITGKSGSGLFIIGQTPPTQTPRGNIRIRGKQDRVCQAFERDVIQGVLHPGALLPGTKELAVRYGVSVQTMRKVTGTLCRKNLLQPYMNKFRIPAMEASRGANTVVLITRGDRQGNLQISTPRFEEHIRALENRCSRSNAQLRSFMYDHEGDHFYPLRQWRELLADKSEGVLGFMIWPISMRQDKLLDLLTLIAGFKKPISILDEQGDAAIPPAYTRSGAVRIFSMANSSTATRQVGQYLMRLGHTNVAFISPFHASVWSQNRLGGLLAAYETAGIEGNVHVFTETNKAAIGNFWHLTGMFHSALESLQKDIALLEPADAEIGLRATRNLLNGIQPVMEQESRRTGLVKLFDKALGTRGITAWVCANDEIAIKAMEYLHAKGRTVPEDVSVIGLDDSLEAHALKISSYNFNGSAVIHAMVHHILAPTTAWRTGQETVEVEGFINMRSTTGPAGARKKPHRN